MIGWLIFLACSIGTLLLVRWKKEHFEFEHMIKWEFKKSKLKFLRKLPDIPIIYTIMQKTKFGIAWCDRFVFYHPKLIRRMKWPIIILSMITMILTVSMIVWGLQDQIIKELTKVEYAMSSVALILPFKVESKAVFYVPFIYWMISVFVTLLIHEGGHAIVARYLKVPIKSTGLAIMGIILPIVPAAYVQPDDEKLLEEKTSDKIWMFAAGAIFNIIFAVFIFIIIIALSILAGVMGWPVQFPIETGPVWWLYFFNTIQMIFVFNFGIGMMNLFPMVPLDGGHIIKSLFEKWKWKEWTWKATSLCSLVLLVATFTVPSIVKKIVGG